MSIYYDLFPSPPQPGKENKRELYVRPVMPETVTTEELAEEISHYTSFSAANVQGVLITLGKEIARCLGSSRNIRLDGIGTFSLSLEGPIVTSPKEVRSEHIKVKKILFRVDPELKKSVQCNPIKRVERRRKYARFTEAQRKDRILWYINRHGSIYKTKARELNNCSNVLAGKDLQALLSAGEIKTVHLGRYAAYVKS